jgi:molecular chaperone GrpE
MSDDIIKKTDGRQENSCPVDAAEETPVVIPPPADVSSLTSEQLTELQAKAAKADEYWDRLLRHTADFDNFKKRNARERQEAVKFANVALLEKLLPVLDNFEMAMAAANASGEAGMASLQKGISMIFSQFKGVMAEAGLEEIDAAGKPFDPNVHEAVSQQESAEVPESHVLQQVRKGYRLKERLIRPASVIVSRKPGT